MNKCHHPQACYERLRLQYVVHAQEDAANYPLKCFWPGCERTLRDVQVRQFVENRHELEQHYEMEGRTTHQRTYQRKEEERRILEQRFRAMLLDRRVERLKVPYPCPECSTTNAVRPFGGTTSFCSNCPCLLVVDSVTREEIRSVVKAVGELPFLLPDHGQGGRLQPLDLCLWC